MILQLTMACGVLLLASINRAAAGADWLYLADNGDYYLNLPRDNWSEYFPLRVVWSKLRLTTSTMKEGATEITVDMTDTTYSKANGEQASHHKLYHLEWGIAGDCRYGSRYQSSYKLNLEGTPFRLEDGQPAASTPTGWQAHGSASCEAGQKVCAGTCGGYCGFCGFGHAGDAQFDSIILVVDDQDAFDDAFRTSTTVTVTTTTATSKTATTTTTTTTTTSGTTTSVTYTTQMECTTGEFRDPRTNTCKPCAEGTYRPDPAHTIATCIAHSTCKGHEFVLVKPTASSNVHCASSELCNAGEWESTPPKQGEDERECTPLTQCNPGEFIAVAAKTDADQQCAACDGSSKSFRGGCTSSSTTTVSSTSATTTTSTTRSATTTSATTTSVTATTSTSTSTSTTTTTTIASDEAQLSGADILKQEGKTLADIVADMHADNLDVELQVMDLVAAGFSLTEIVGVGYTKSEVKSAGYTGSEYNDASEEAAIAAASIAGADAAASGAGMTFSATTLVKIIAVVIVLVVVAAAAVFVRRNSNSNNNAGMPLGFENPMYASAGPAFAAEFQEPAYADSGAAGSGYMDVGGVGGSAGGGSGYMDVNPTAAGGGPMYAGGADGGGGSSAASDEDV